MAYAVSIFKKVGQDAGLFDIARHAAQGVRTTGQTAPQRYYGPENPFEGTVNPMNLAMAAGGTIGGEGLQALMAAGLPLLMPMLQRAGIDMRQPIQLYPSGSEFEQNRALAAIQAMQRAQWQANAGSVANIGSAAADKLGEYARRLFPNQAPRVEQALGQFKSWLPNLDPSTTGLVLTQLGQAFPEINDVISAVDPGFISDPTPLANAVIARNGGHWNDQDFNKLFTDYQQAYKSGMFPGLPAQMGLNAVQIATEQGATDPLQGAANMSTAARSLMESGAVEHFGDALTLAKEIDPQSFKNPARAQGVAKWIADAGRTGLVDPKQYGAAARVAREQGIPLSMAMSTLTQATNVGKTFQGNPTLSRQISQDVAGTYQRGGQSSTMKILQAAMNTNPALRPQIQKAIASGDSRMLLGLANRAARNPRVMQVMRGTDPSQLMESMDPRVYSDVMTADAATFAKRTGVPGVGRVFNDAKRLQRVATGDWTGLDPQAIRFFQSQPGRNAVSSAVAGTIPKPQFKTQPTEPLVSTPPTNKPLGMKYPGVTPPV